MQNVKVDRDKFIGGSDVPIIMEISPFKTRWELLQEKAGLIQNEFEGNEYTEYGNVMEPKIRDYINQSKKDKFVEGKDIDGDIRCHTDGINKTTVLEIKTTSQIHEKLEDYKIYLVQLLFYMEHTKRKKGILAVYQRPKDFNADFDEKNLSIYEINIKDYKELTEDINNAVDRFRTDLERVKENPFMTEEELLPADVIKLSAMIEVKEQELKMLKEKEKDLKALKDNLLENMEKYNIKKWETPKGTIFTRVEGVPASTKIVEKFNEDKFKTENKELFEKYIEKIEQKSNGRKGYVKVTFPKEV